MIKLAKSALQGIKYLITLGLENLGIKERKIDKLSRLLDELSEVNRKYFEIAIEPYNEVTRKYWQLSFRLNWLTNNKSTPSYYIKKF